MQKHYLAVEDHQNGDTWLLIVATRSIVSDEYVRNELVSGTRGFYKNLKGEIPNLKWSDVVEHFHDIVKCSRLFLAERCQMIRTGFSAKTNQYLGE